MARIPPEEIDRLKAEVSVQRLAEARGIVLKPHGKNLIGLCPFHEDHDPSLVITPEKNLWNCLGACGSGGSVIDWVMKAEGVSFRHAVEILRAGSFSTGPIRPVKGGRARGRLPAPVSFEAEDRELMGQVIGHYHHTLKESPDALAYLEKRGLAHSEMIDQFKLGFSNRTLGLRLPEKNRVAGAAIRGKLIKLGLYRETGHEQFAGCVVFPIPDELGNVVGVYGRRIIPDGCLKWGAVPHLYLPGPHKGVFNFPALSASRDVILCEAIIDALSFWCAGFRNVTASYGVNGFTPDHLAAFKKHGIERVFIAYDRDTAGNKAAEALAEELIGEGFECFRVLFPKDMDANEYALKVLPPEKSLGLALCNALWMGKGKRPADLDGFRTPEAPPPEPATKGEIDGREFEGEPDGRTRREAAPPSGPVSTPASETIAEPAPAQIPTMEPIPEALSFLAVEAPAPLLYSSEPAPTVPEVEVRAEEIIMRLADRRWRIRGLLKNMSYDQLKVNLLVSHAGGHHSEAYFVDTFDLYSARSRTAYQKQAADEMRLKEEVIRSDLGKILLKLEELQDKQIREALEPKEKAVVLTEAEKAEALELLKDPRLIDRILSEFENCGIVGEANNKLTGYLAAVSRKLITPLAVIIQSSSAAGKTSLMEAVLAFIPEEERVKYSAMTGQSLFYMGETNLKHKILALVEEEGAERASYALKLLQSEGELTIASTGKDPQTGRLITHEYRVEGPVMIFVTTTSINIDQELQNRCIVLTVDESREQTRAIHQRQRERRTLEGLWARQERTEILRRHRNAQRLLKPVHIINPYARRLTFLDDQTRTRRDHDRYLDLIESITILHQYQRPFKVDRKGVKEIQYLEVTLEDIELGNRLMHEVLGRSLDELPPQTRRFLLLLEGMVRQSCEKLNISQTAYRFRRREILDAIGWSYDQVRVHLERLIELEYVMIHRGCQGLRFEYELLYDGRGKDGKPFFSGLIDTSAIRQKMAGGDPQHGTGGLTQTLGGSGGTLGSETPGFGGSLAPTWGPVGEGLGGSANPEMKPVPEEKPAGSSKQALKGVEPQKTSYPKADHNPKDKGNGSAGRPAAATAGEAD